MAPTDGAALTLEDIRASSAPDPNMMSYINMIPDLAHFNSQKPADAVKSMKAEANANFITLKARQDTTRRPTLRETQTFVQLATGYTSRVIVVRPKTANNSAHKAPIVVFFHSGGWFIGFPEYHLTFARQAAEATGAVVVLPSYRLAPEHPYPAGIADAWTLVRHVAQEAAAPPGERRLLPPDADANAGFIVAGSCAGANFASVVAHLARDTGLQPPLTGQYLSEGHYMLPAKRVPAPYAERWVSHEENKQDPLLPSHILEELMELLRPPEDGDKISCFTWPNWKEGVDEEGKVGKGHVGLPPVYFQAAGMALARDDTLVYEAVLKEESGVSTRLDLYPGIPHSALVHFDKSPMSKKWDADSLAGLKWLLEQHSP